jgi:hypothetical protein
VLISDGEDQGAGLSEAIRKAKERGIAVHTILIGTADGATIPLLGGGGPMHDDSGQVITTYAHADTLQSIAHGTGGAFLENPFSEHALDPLLLRVVRGRARQTEARVPIDRYQWPLALAFAFLLLGSLAHRGAE